MIVFPPNSLDYIRWQVIERFLNDNLGERYNRYQLLYLDVYELKKFGIDAYYMLEDSQVRVPIKEDTLCKEEHLLVLEFSDETQESLFRLKYM